MRRPLSLLLLLSLVAAGCVTSPNGDGQDGDGIDPTDVSWAARAVPSDDAHAHDDPAQHANLSTPNFQVVGWDPLVSDAFGATPGGFFCGGAGTTAEGRKLAVVHSYHDHTDVAFVVVDVTDPRAPAKVGEYILERSHIYDATVSLDGRFVVLGANPEIPSLPIVGAVQVVQPKWRDACTGVLRAAGPEQALPLSPGVILVDLADPTNPVFADFAPTPALGPHSVHAGKVADANVFLASITNLEHQASYFQFYGVTELPVVGPKLTLLSTYQGPPGPQSNVPLVNGHVDGYIAKHPLTGQTLAYLANWDAGMIILDISNPRVPIEVATWGGASEGFGGAPVTFGDDNLGGIHGTYPLPVTWNDRHYTFAGQELVGRPDNRPTGWIFVIDTTDPANPTEVGRWTLPVDVKWSESLEFSTHYFVVVNRTLFVSMYHGGVWAVDVSDDALEQPRAVGVWIPDRVSPQPPGPEGRLSTSDMVLDVIALEDGTLLSFGSRSGAYLLRYDESRPMPAPPAWDPEAAPGNA